MRTNFNSAGCRTRNNGAETTRLYIHHEISIVSTMCSLQGRYLWPLILILCCGSHCSINEHEVDRLEVPSKLREVALRICSAVGEQN